MLASGLTVTLAGCLETIAGRGDGDDDANESDTSGGIDLGVVALNDNQPLLIVDTDDGRTIANVHLHENGEDHWHRAPFEIPADGSRTVKVRLRDPAGDDLPVGRNEPIRLAIADAGDSAAGAFDADVDGDLVTFTGTTAGESELSVVVIRTDDDEQAWQTPTLSVDVTAYSG